MDRINACRDSRQLAHQSGAPQSPTLSGYCKLDKGRSVTLQTRQASVLRITRGRVWLTFNPALNEPSERLGDHFLGRGESISLAAGEAVVMESYGPDDAPSAYYSWEAAAEGSAAAMLARRLAALAEASMTGVASHFATVVVAEKYHEYWIKQALRPKSGDACPGCGGH